MATESIPITEYILIMLSFLLLLVAITIAIIYLGKVHLQKVQLKHEIEIKKLEFTQKQEWEKLINAKLEKKEDENWIKEKNELKKRVDELWGKRNAIAPVDMNRIALLHLVLSGNKEGITAENLEKEIDKIKKSYKIIEQYLKD